MREYKNIFEIWRDRGRKVPFKVTNSLHWRPSRVLEICRVTDAAERWGGFYGKAWTKDQWYEERKRTPGAPGEKLVNLAGCYQWVEVSDSPTPPTLNKEKGAAHPKGESGGHPLRAKPTPNNDGGD